MVRSPPWTGRYEKLKNELIKQLANPYAVKAWKSLQNEKIETRMPSQFYKHLTGMAGTWVSDDLVRMLWIKSLPPSVQQALDLTKNMDADALAEMADRIYKIWSETGQIPAASAEQTTAVSKQSNCALDALNDRISRLEEQTSMLTLDRCQSTSLQQPGLWHRSLSDCANKCYYPCSWNQNQRNETQSSMITTYDVDMWGCIYVRDTLSEYTFLVDTGASLSMFPRHKLPACNNRVKDENYHLIAANGTKIDTYGRILVYLSLGHKWKFQWHFIVADVIEPTIGMDFMQHHGFLVDTQNKCLFRSAEPAYEILCQGCHWGYIAPHKPNLLTKSFPEFPNLKRRSAFGRGKVPNAERDSSATLKPHTVTRPGLC
ncbi:uncharacterized protein LOC143303148 [Bombus vancouverensis nearcticus]|uniref:uncharacterized protein LOC143303148 n=1 Tax=Bombus vancouverensis nearcticus TaxID=2705178 RepID=UPI00402BEFC7